MSTKVVLDNVADTTSADISTSRRESLVWVTAGSCNVIFEGSTLVALTVGDYKIINIGSGEALTFTATAAGTTAKIKDIQQENQ